MPRVLVVPTLGKRGKTEIDIRLTNIEAFGSSLFVTTILSPTEQFCLESDAGVPICKCVQLVCERSSRACVMAADYRCAAKIGYLLYSF